MKPLVFFHRGNMFNSKLRKNLAHLFLSSGEAWEGLWQLKIASLFPLFHVCYYTKPSEPDRAYQNLSFLWFLYWHWKIKGADEIYKTSHHLIFWEKKSPAAKSARKLELMVSKAADCGPKTWKLMGD